MSLAPAPDAALAPLRLRPAPSSEEPVRERVRRFLGQLLHRQIPRERRSHARLPFPMLIRLTPVDPRTMQPVAEAVTVVGKNLSEEGLGFYHKEPFPYRQAVVTLEDQAGRTVSLLISLSWCRFSRLGWYDSGGRFLEIIEPLQE